MKNRNERLELLLGLEEPRRRAELRKLTEHERKELRYHWRLWAWNAQLAPECDWSTWLVMAKRFEKQKTTFLAFGTKLGVTGVFSRHSMAVER